MLSDNFQRHFANQFTQLTTEKDGMLTASLDAEHLLEMCKTLRDHDDFSFNMLMDVCAVDYLEYGLDEWRTHEVTTSGYSRATQPLKAKHQTQTQTTRFVVVYHLLSLSNNWRLRLRVELPETQDQTPSLPSVTDIWPAANWFEREAFDLMGVVFNGHPDLRRLLTDYGFKGHPFRRDFPLVGELELRYDKDKQCCVYEPVSIQERVLVPKVIRRDNRYAQSQASKPKGDEA